jgi:hypothetical protein
MIFRTKKRCAFSNKLNHNIVFPRNNLVIPACSWLYTEMRNWWIDDKPKEEFTIRAEAGSWFVVAEPIERNSASILFDNFSNSVIVGRVLRVIYAGYKVSMPNGEEIIVNPDKMSVVDVISFFPETESEIYCAAKQKWEALCAERELKEQIVKAEAKALFEKQNNCMHERTNCDCSLRAAGCDIYDTVCFDCGKYLKRSWATAYDKDPDDQISDWNWWCREHMLQFKTLPKKENYDIVDSIFDGIYSRS